MEEKNISSQSRAVMKYKTKTYEELRITVLKGQKELLKQTAASAGESLTQYVLKSINIRRQQDGLEPIKTLVSE